MKTDTVTQGKSAGQVAFEAYHSQFVWPDGLPKWSEQETRGKWESAAQAVLAAFPSRVLTTEENKLTEARLWELMTKIGMNISIQQSRDLFIEIEHLNSLHPVTSKAEAQVEWEVNYILRSDKIPSGWEYAGSGEAHQVIRRRVQPQAAEGETAASIASKICNALPYECTTEDHELIGLEISMFTKSLRTLLAQEKSELDKWQRRYAESVEEWSKKHQEKDAQLAQEKAAREKVEKDFMEHVKTGSLWYQNLGKTQAELTTANAKIELLRKEMKDAKTCLATANKDCFEGQDEIATLSAKLKAAETERDRFHEDRDAVVRVNQDLRAQLDAIKNILAS